MVQNTLPKAVQDCHNLIVWLMPQLDNFPHNRRFTLGERLESGLLEMLECLVEAAYVKNKRDPLKRANMRLAVIQHLWRMAYELQTIPAKRYEQGARLLEELGRQVGGWLKSVETPQ